MTEDEIVARVGEHVREAQESDARFERVARGEADAAELAELERAAADDPELAIRLEASRPLDAAVVEAIARKVAPGQAPPAARPAQPNVALGPWRRRLVLAAGPLALAAAMILYVTTQSGPSGPELPSYSVTASGQQAMRGPAEPAARLRVAKTPDRSARFEIILRPATAPVGKVVAYAFTFGAGSTEAVPLEAKVEIAPEGAVRLTGSSRTLGAADDIRIVLGEPTAIGKFDDAASRAASSRSDARVRVLTVPIDRE